MPAGKGRYTVGAKGTHGCSGYPVVGGEGKVHGCHKTKSGARAQQAAIYASEGQTSKAMDVLETIKSINENCGCSGQPNCECDNVESDTDMGMHKSDNAEVEKKMYSASQRRRMAASGQAMPDGSFPIANRADLQNAIQSVGRASNYDAAKAHIMRRAKALNAMDMLPEEWRSTKKMWGGFIDPRNAKDKTF